MIKNIKRIRFIAICILFAVILSASLNAFAEDMSSFQTDPSTGWCFSSGNHMGTKNTTFAFSSASVVLKYGFIVVQGILLWGNEIICVPGGNSPAGTIETSTQDLGWFASASRDAVNNSNHVIKWTLTIYPVHFDKALGGSSQQAMIIAHEIGHVYGLGHVSNKTQVMYTFGIQGVTVTQNDKAGMRVMTHAHTHSGGYPKEYNIDSSYHHKVRCRTCKAFALADCTYSDYHAGSKHYFKFNCICGRNTTISWSCNGKPCITPLSLSHVAATH